jgi:hypothetical protein
METKELSQNAFSKKLSPLGFNMFKMFVVDLMHEFELNVWRGLFIHLLRILDSADNALLHELDRRYGDLSMLHFFMVTNTYLQVQADTEFWQRHDQTLLK